MGSLATKLNIIAVEGALTIGSDKPIRRSLRQVLSLIWIVILAAAR
jgi:hypothetical protein